MSALRILEGTVGHARPGPGGNRFRYPLFYFAFSLREEAGVRALLRKKFGRWIQVRPEDYLDGQKLPLQTAARDFLERELGLAPSEVELQTMPRMFGYGFNPISFWWCERGGAWLGVLAEVNNTFGERHCYWVDPAAADSEGWIRAQKVFHVSPFFPVEGHYRFRFRRDKDSFRAQIHYHGADGALQLSTWLDGAYRDAEAVSKMRLLLRYGWMPVVVMARIHYQALRLFLRRIPFFSKPLPPLTKVTGKGNL